MTYGTRFFLFFGKNPSEGLEGFFLSLYKSPITAWYFYYPVDFLRRNQPSLEITLLKVSIFFSFYWAVFFWINCFDLADEQIEAEWKKVPLYTLISLQTPTLLRHIILICAKDFDHNFDRYRFGAVF